MPHSPLGPFVVQPAPPAFPPSPTLAPLALGCDCTLGSFCVPVHLSPLVRLKRLKVSIAVPLYKYMVQYSTASTRLLQGEHVREVNVSCGRCSGWQQSARAEQHDAQMHYEARSICISVHSCRAVAADGVPLPLAERGTCTAATVVRASMCRLGPCLYRWSQFLVCVCCCPPCSPPDSVVVLPAPPALPLSHTLASLRVRAFLMLGPGPTAPRATDHRVDCYEAQFGPRSTASEYERGQEPCVCAPCPPLCPPPAVTCVLHTMYLEGRDAHFGSRSTTFEYIRDLKPSAGAPRIPVYLCWAAFCVLHAARFEGNKAHFRHRSTHFEYVRSLKLSASTSRVYAYLPLVGARALINKVPGCFTASGRETIDLDVESRTTEVKRVVFTEHTMPTATEQPSGGSSGTSWISEYTF